MKHTCFFGTYCPYNPTDSVSSTTDGIKEIKKEDSYNLVKAKLSKAVEALEKLDRTGETIPCDNVNEPAVQMLSDVSRVAHDALAEIRGENEPQEKCEHEWHRTTCKKCGADVHDVNKENSKPTSRLYTKEEVGEMLEELRIPEDSRGGKNSSFNEGYDLCALASDYRIDSLKAKLGL